MKADRFVQLEGRLVAHLIPEKSGWMVYWGLSYSLDDEGRMRACPVLPTLKQARDHALMTALSLRPIPF